MKLYALTTTDAALNLACEEMLTHGDDEPVFMLWQNAPSIIIGCNQNTAAEIDADFVQRRRIPVVRRMTGGGAVYHDLGNVNYSCIVPGRLWGNDSAAEFTAPILNALNELGVPAEFAGRNDIVANGCKISGCARSVPGNHTLFHGTLLFSAELDVLSQALRPDPEKIRSKGIKSVRARVGNICEMLPKEHQGMTMEEFLHHLRQSVCRFFHREEFDVFPTVIKQEAEALANQKYRTWEWNYGTSLTYEVRKRCRFSGGIVVAEFNVQNNCLAELRISGDFLGLYPVAGLVGKLIGISPRKEAILSLLAEFPFQDYIAGITAEELASLLAV